MAAETTSSNKLPATSQMLPDEAGICTLFEGDYHLGLAAFVNSLVRAGYKGTIWAGYRGDLPSWIGQLEHVQSDNANEYRISDGIRILFLKVATNIHLTNYKPDFMLRLLDHQANGLKYLWYFDPDIFLLMSWSYFDNWRSYGVALCQEIVDNILPSDAPLRRQWMKIAEGIGYSNPRPVDQYFNAGMVGIPADSREFLLDWKKLIEQASSMGYDLKSLWHGGRELPFNISDQDALNIAAMYTRCPLTTLGPQGMGFVFGASMAMYHAVGQKPWRGSFLLRALKGMPPSGAMKCFLTNADGPIRPYSRVQLSAKRFACSLASLIGRFYRRS